MIAGIIIYLIPVAIRFATGKVEIIPFLNWPGYWIDHIIPGNLLEKILVNAFFPGAAGAIAGEVFVGYYQTTKTTNTTTKYLSTVCGGDSFCFSLFAFQYWGYSLSIYIVFSQQQPV